MPISRSPGKVHDLALHRNGVLRDTAVWLEPNDNLGPGLPLSVSTAFHDLAAWILDQITVDSVQLINCMDALIQAKDYAVRAAIINEEAASGVSQPDA